MSATAELPQHLTALEKGNRIRLFRSRLKRRIASGETTVGAVLEAAPGLDDMLGAMEVRDLLLAIPRVGRSIAPRLLQRADIKPAARVGRLTVRQRRALADVLADR